MRPVSHQMLVAMPAIVALVLVLLFATPYDTSFSYAPNVGWVMTLVVVALYPPAWPRGFAFGVGLLQDVLFATPLGSQALLTLLLTQLAWAQAGRQQAQLFRLRWLEAAGVLVVWHLLLWLLCYGVASNLNSLKPLLREGLISALWYPVFYFFITRAFAKLEDVN